jgi:sulfur carrier protein
MMVVVNGEERALPEGATVADAVAAAGVPAPDRGLAVAVDGEVVPRAAWSETELHEGRRIEVLRAVQGGMR